jgi:hypothetical protein
VVRTRGRALDALLTADDDPEREAVPGDVAGGSEDDRLGPGSGAAARAR